MSNDYVRKPDLRLVEILTGLAAHYGKTYCFPSYKKILILLVKRYSVEMSKRTLARHLGALESMFYIGRVRRHKRERPKRAGVRGRIIFRSTLYHIYPRARQAVVGFVKPFLKNLFGVPGHDGCSAVPIVALNDKSLLRLLFTPSTA